MKIFTKLFLFIVISYSGLFVVNFFYEKKAKKNYIDKPSYIISFTNENYDYVVGGSSRVHNNFNSLLFDSICHLNGFNIGYDGSAMSQNYLTLYLFLKNGNKTKTYLQQVEDNFLIDPVIGYTHPFYEYFFMSYIGDRNVDECYKNNVSLLKFWIWKYIPFIKYAEFNNYYGLKKYFIPSKFDSSILRYKGYSKLEQKHKKGFPTAKYDDIKKEIPLHQSNIYYLNKIQNLCIKNDIQFVIYSSPLHHQSYLAYKPDNLHKSLLNYVQLNNIKYYNFMNDETYNDNLFFYDETHLNAYGTDIFTRQLADSLKNILKK